MKVFLKVKSPKKEISFEASTNEVTIGRGEQAKVRVDDNNCSRIHCKIYLRKNALWIEDTGSKNGTYINGLKKAKSQLFINDKVLIGDTEIFVSPDNNNSEVIKLFKFTGNPADRAKASLEIEDQESLTEVRMNPLTALKNPSKASKKSKWELDSDPLFKDSRTAVPEFRTIQKSKDDLVTARWKYHVASLIDLFFYLLAFAASPYFFWFHNPTRSRISGLGQSLGIHEIILVGGGSLVSMIVVWIISSKSAKGTIGERLLGVTGPDED